MSGIVRARSATLQRFTGGLNNYWDQSSIADNELADIVNFEFTANGSLMSRPAIYPEKIGSNPVYTPVTGEPVDILGAYIRQDGVRFLVAVTTHKTWVYNVIAQTWTQIADFKASDCTQYLNKIVLSSTQAGQGGYWENGLFTNTPTMPALGGIELFQTRFFGYGVEGTTTANIIYWTNVSTAGPSGESTSVWNWLDENLNYMYVEIGGGDGQWITAMAQGYNDIVIFRNRSTYRYSYGDVPEEGTIQVMQQDIGAENRRSVVKFENAHFVLSGGILYKYQNWLYYPLNAQRVKFGSVSFNKRFEHAVSIVGRRCIVWHNGSIHAYNLDTETWGKWESTSKVAYFVSVPRRSEELEESLYFGISGATTQTQAGLTDFALYRIEDSNASLNGGAESMKCYLKTKIYDFDTPVEWKRLYFWTADLATALPAKAVAYPVALTENAVQISWDEISLDISSEVNFSTWDDLSFDGIGDATSGSWDDLKKPSGQIGTIIDNIPTGVSPIRLEAKLNQSLRFRRIYFELYLDCDGTASTSPVQVFSITPMIGVKAKIQKEAN
jgi:hypothetical protein